MIPYNPFFILILLLVLFEPKNTFRIEGQPESQILKLKELKSEFKEKYQKLLP
jgi:hypothetical protein